MNNAFVIDIEADNLYPYFEEIWTICIKKVNSDERIIINPFQEEKEESIQKIYDFIFRSDDIPYIIGHNYLGFDAWVIWKYFGIKVIVKQDKHYFGDKEVKYFDTLYASQYTLPDRPEKHSLKSWGILFGDNKIDYRNQLIESSIIDKTVEKGEEFSQWTEFMDEYCSKDCDIAETVFLKLYEKITEQHNTLNSFFNGQRNFFLMCAQSFTGFKFDIEKGKKLKIQIEEMIQSIKNEVEPQLPLRSLKKAEESEYTIPASIYKKNGELSSHMLKFIEKHNAEILDDNKIKVYDKIYDLIPKLVLDIKKPMQIEDQNELKDYFLEQGWEPTLFNIKKDKNGKAERDSNKQLIFTTPKIQDNGKICPNLLELQGDLPKKIVKFLSLRNRLGTLNGFLENKRLEFDGRLSAGSSGIAATHRQKHTTINY